MIGAQIDNYKITEKLGDGGMGSVYKAVDVMLERQVALKFLRPELAQQPDLVERFRAEAVVLAKLNHQSIAALYGLHRHGDDFFMAMEYVPGVTLESLLKQEGQLPVARAAGLAGLVLDALEYAHGRGVVHRDIKTANVIVTPDGNAKVMDFGIARVLGTERRTRVGFVVGTIGYMAPEQIQGLDVDGRTDIYALGVMLYEMLTGRMPFQGETEFSVMQAQIQQMPVPPRVYAAIPVPVENTIMRSLAKLPHERFQTAAEFHGALRDSLRVSAMYPAMKPPIAAASDETREFKSDPHLVAPAPPAAANPYSPWPSSGTFPSSPTDRSSAFAPAVPQPPPLPPGTAAAFGERPASPDSAPAAPFGGTPGAGYSAAWTGRAARPPAPAGAAMEPVVPVVPTASPARPATEGPAAPSPKGPAARKPATTSVFFVAGFVLLALTLAGVGYRAWEQWRQSAGTEIDASATSQDQAGSLAPSVEPSVPTLPPAAPAAPAPPGASQPLPRSTAKPPTQVGAARASTQPPAQTGTAPDPATQAAGEPQTAAPAEAPKPSLPPAMFGNAKWMQIDGTRVRENGGFLQITDSEVRVLDDRGRTVLARAAFGSISEVHYSSGKRPAWRKDLGPVPAESAFDTTVRTFHYLAFQGPQHFLLVRVDRDDLPRLRDELKKRSGLLIQ